MDPIDKLLSELQAEYQQSGNSQTEKKEEEKQVNQVKKINLDSSFPSSSLFESSSKGDAIDNILSEVKQEIEEKQLLEEEQKQQAIAEERIRQEKIKAQKLEALKGQAKEWLEKLEPLSPEGMWFESFAQSYPSKLEAAIEYLSS
ncbi:hypothetical protein NIES267_62900 [Calothrix parasitica NIES-267]|uniref:Uncharacterized protein n=1 Tax=Calothrix parasitica NIES-267 TaxID=1973488 RepID=A0A1Z4LZV2_9CYAN|nr:hypothetical protein NIES267_62900 [Calothrix parasitica NIES-267]